MRWAHFAALLALAAAVADAITVSVSGTETLSGGTYDAVSISSPSKVVLEDVTTTTVTLTSSGTAPCSVTLLRVKAETIIGPSSTMPCSISVIDSTLGAPYNGTDPSGMTQTAIAMGGTTLGGDMNITNSEIFAWRMGVQILRLGTGLRVTNTNITAGAKHASSSSSSVVAAVYIAYSTISSAVVEIAGSSLTVNQTLGSGSHAALNIVSLSRSAVSITASTIAVNHMLQGIAFLSSTATRTCITVVDTTISIPCEGSCTTYWGRGVDMNSVAQSSIAVVNVTMALSTQGRGLRLGIASDTAISLRRLTVTGATSGYGVNLGRFEDSSMAMAESTITVGAGACIQYPTSLTSGTLRGMIGLVNNTFACTGQATSPSTPQWVSVIGQCNAFDAIKPRMYGHGRELDCPDDFTAAAISDLPIITGLSMGYDAWLARLTCNNVDQWRSDSLVAIYGDQHPVISTTGSATLSPSGVSRISVSSSYNGQLTIKDCNVHEVYVTNIRTTVAIILDNVTVHRITLAPSTFAGTLTVVNSTIGSLYQDTAMKLEASTTSSTAATISITDSSVHAMRYGLFTTLRHTGSISLSNVTFDVAGPMAPYALYVAYLNSGSSLTMNATRVTVLYYPPSSGTGYGMFINSALGSVALYGAAFNVSSAGSTALLFGIDIGTVRSCVTVDNTTIDVHGVSSALEAFRMQTLTWASVIVSGGSAFRSTAASGRGLYFHRLQSTHVLLKDSTLAGGKCGIYTYSNRQSHVVMSNMAIDAPTADCICGAVTNNNHDAGVLDLRGGNYECNRVMKYDSTSSAYQTLDQSCVSVNGAVRTAAIGSPLWTTYHACVGNTPRTTAVDMITAAADSAAVCAARVAMTPFYIPPTTSVTGSYSSSDADLGQLTITNPGTVVLENIVAATMEVQPGSASNVCRITIRRSTIKYMRFYASLSPCTVTIEHSTLGSTATSIAVQWDTADTVATKLLVAHSTITASSAGFRATDVFGNHTFANTTIRVTSNVGPGVSITSDLYGHLGIVGCDIQVTGGASTSTVRAVYVYRANRASSSADRPTMLLQRSSLRATGSTAVSNNVRVLDVASSTTYYLCATIEDTTVTATGVTVRGIYFSNIQRSSLALTNVTVDISAEVGYPMTTVSLTRAAVSVVESTFKGVTTSASSGRVMSGWYWSSMSDANVVMTRSTVSVAGSAPLNYCFRWPTSCSCSNGAGFITLASNTFVCASGSDMASSSPSWVGATGLLAQCNTRGPMAGSESEFYTGATPHACPAGHTKSAAEVAALPVVSDLVLSTNVAAAICPTESTSPFVSSRVTRTVSSAQTVPANSAGYSTITVSGATALVSLVDLDVLKLEVKLNSANTHILVRGGKVRAIQFVNTFAGTLELVDTQLGGLYGTVGLIGQTGSTSNVTIVNTKITASTYGISLSSVQGTVNMRDSQVDARCAGTCYGVLIDAALGDVKLANNRVNVQGTTTLTSYGIRIDPSASSTNPSTVELTSNKVNVSAPTGRAYGIYFDSITSSCVTLNANTVTASNKKATSSSSSIVGIYFASASLSTLTIGQETAIDIHGGTRGIGVYFGTMYRTAVLVDSVDINLKGVSTSTSTIYYGVQFYKLDQSTAAIVSTTLRSLRTCLRFPSLSTSSPGVVDLRDVSFAQCASETLYTSTSTAYVHLRQNCARLSNGDVTTALLGASTWTTVYPCVNGKPRSAAIDLTSYQKPTAALCSAVKSIDPFALPIVLSASGDVTYTDQRIGDLTLTNPGTVSLSNVQGKSIVIQVSARRRATTAARITIDRSELTGGGITVRHSLPSMDLTITNTVINSDAFQSLSMTSVSNVKLTVTNCTLNARNTAFYVSSSIQNTNFVFTNSVITAAPSSYTAYAMLWVQTMTAATIVLTNTTVTVEKPSSTSSGTALAMSIPAATSGTVRIVGSTVQAVFRGTKYGLHFAGQFTSGCINVVDSNIRVTCAGNSLSTSTCASSTGVGINWNSGQSSSTTRIVRTKITVASYYGRGISFIPYHTDLYIIQSNIQITGGTTSTSNTYALGTTARGVNAVIMASNSTFAVNTNSGVVLAIATTNSPTHLSFMFVNCVIDHPSSSRNIMAMTTGTGYQGAVGCLRRQDGINITQGYLNVPQVRSTPCVSYANVAPTDATCGSSSQVNNALGVSTDRSFNGGGGSGTTGGGGGSSGSSPAGSQIWIMGPVAGGIIVMGFIGYAVYSSVRNNNEEEEDNANYGNNNNDNVNAADANNNAGGGVAAAAARVEVGHEQQLFEDVNMQNLDQFNLGNNQVNEANLFQEQPADDTRLNDLVRHNYAQAQQMHHPGMNGMPPHAAFAPNAPPTFAAPFAGGAPPPMMAQPPPAAVAVPPPRPASAGANVVAATDDVTHPLIVAQAELAEVTRGERQGPVELPQQYPEYATRAFENVRWRSADGRAAGFQAHDVYAGILYPYAISVTAYGATSDVAMRIGTTAEAWGRAISAANGVDPLGIHVQRIVLEADAAKVMDATGLSQPWMRKQGVLFVYVVTPFEPMRLSLQKLRVSATPKESDPTTPSPALSHAHWHTIAAKAAAAYIAARAAGLHTPLHNANVFVDPVAGRVMLKDRRPDGLPDDEAAARELLAFAQELRPEITWNPGSPLTVSNVAAAVGEPTPAPSLAFLDDGSFPLKVTAECAICYNDVPSSESHLEGAECCAPSRHFVCAECINMRVSAALTDAKTDFASLPCAMAPACTSVWAFDDFGALVTPQNLRKWHKLSVEHAQREAQQQAAANMEALQQQLTAGAQVSAAQNELRRHVTEVRRCLRPACPHCGMPFESFTGCLAVKCGAQDNAGRQVQGCGKEFCGACMVASPCPKRCGHRFVSPGQLHTEWQGWRREKVLQYLRANFRRGPQDQHRDDEERGRMLDLTLRAVRGDLVTAAIYPLGDGFPNPQ